MGIIAYLLILLTFTGIMLHDLATGQWSHNDWYLVGSCVFFAIILLAIWRMRPNAVRLYAIETGDTSRLIDERMRQVNGNAAYITLNIFLVLLIFIGAPYEAIMTGGWPVRTFVEIVALIVISIAATTYWNNRL